jgi:hypothetical protein
VASDVAVNFNATNFGADGTLGMGLRGLSPFNATTIFETLVEENQLEEPVFGLVLAESNSELIIGGRDSSRFKGNLSYTPVDSGMVRISRCVPLFLAFILTRTRYRVTGIPSLTILQSTGMTFKLTIRK